MSASKYGPDYTPWNRPKNTQGAVAVHHSSQDQHDRTLSVRQTLPGLESIRQTPIGTPRGPVLANRQGPVARDNNVQGQHDMTLGMRQPLPDLPSIRQPPIGTPHKAYLDRQGPIASGHIVPHIHISARVRPLVPPGLYFHPLWQRLSEVPSNAVLTTMQEPPAVKYEVIQTLLAKSAPAGTLIQAKQWCHALLGNQANGGVYHVTIPTNLSFFDIYKEEIEIKNFQLCGQLLRPIHPKLLFPNKNDQIMELLRRQEFPKLLQDMFDRQDREVAMSRPENEAAIAEMLNHPKCRGQKLPEYVGVCVDASRRVNYCTAFKAGMVTLEEFAETENRIYKDLALDIYKLVWHGVKTLHAQGIPHGAIYQNNVYLSWERRAPEEPTGMPSGMVTKVVLGKFGRAVEHTTGRNFSKIDFNSAMRADRLCRRGVLCWMESMMLLEE